MIEIKSHELAQASSIFWFYGRRLSQRMTRSEKADQDAFCAVLLQCVGGMAGEW